VRDRGKLQWQGVELEQRRTLSRMTSGPFTPPMVLYRIRGWTDIMRGSRLDMAAVG
jgi:hypothetical protein